MKPIDYWKECLSQAAEDSSLILTDEQLECLASSAQSAHENYDMAFYSPPPSERIQDIENEWKEKLDAKNREMERYQANAETAIKQALRQHSDANVSIGEHGEVHRYDGRITKIQ